MEAKLNPVTIYNQQAVRLIRNRAKTEGRSLSNAATQTVIEGLQDTYDISGKNTQTSKVCKEKS